jgi:hypothetical protein
VVNPVVLVKNTAAQHLVRLSAAIAPWLAGGADPFAASRMILAKVQVYSISFGAEGFKA